jgi:hypothetical protein
VAVRGKSIKFALAAAAALALVVVLTARGRDDGFDVFTREFDGATGEILKVMAADRTPEGVVRARGVLVAKKEGLRMKLAALKTLTVAQAGGEKLAQLDECLTRCDAKINDFFKEELSRRQRELNELRKRAKERALIVDLDAVDKAQAENIRFRDAMKQLLEDYKSIVE